MKLPNYQAISKFPNCYANQGTQHQTNSAQPTAYHRPIPLVSSTMTWGPEQDNALKSLLRRGQVEPNADRE